MNLHYRSDLQKHDSPIDFNEKVLFRYYVWENKNLYDHLFTLCNHTDHNIAKLAQTLLLRLPTYSKVVESLTHAFDLKGKNSFEI